MAKKTGKKHVVGFRLNDKQMQALEDLADANPEEMSANDLARIMVINGIQKRMARADIPKEITEA